MQANLQVAMKLLNADERNTAERVLELLDRIFSFVLVCATHHIQVFTHMQSLYKRLPIRTFIALYVCQLV